MVGFKNAELVATMCALVQYVHNSRKFNENANCDIINTDQRARDSVTTFVDLAETMIIRLQDALDEDQIDLLCCGGLSNANTSMWGAQERTRQSWTSALKDPRSASFTTLT
jgi:hypothetical protein